MGSKELKGGENLENWGGTTGNGICRTGVLRVVEVRCCVSTWCASENAFVARALGPAFWRSRERDRHC